eukprot:gnl/MRDRNA2_/MRDRNA2_203508_c0_seq1.p1 gnl/MRDRNA2_/MRDRNA2_203508_c0~~gnl/MRDRNA2_/MRDRNA2_203508_c0_seq1.p1  ORF type:complete len:247 (-),score=41.26 gnl/MRDRNA2_/MRDRNA2_203508_c0_seq1:17-670(-)
MALALARSQGLLVGPSSGAAITCALQVGSRPEMHGKRVVVVCPSSAVRYMQHPMFKAIRDEANAVLCADKGPPVPVSAPVMPAERSFAKNHVLSPETFNHIENAILQMARDILKSPTLEAHEPMIDYGATSLTAMLILGKVRSTVLHKVEALGLSLPSGEMSALSKLHGMKIAIIKDALWGSVRELTQSVLGIDDDRVQLPYDCNLRRKIVVTYCGG